MLSFVKQTLMTCFGGESIDKEGLLEAENTRPSNSRLLCHQQMVQTTCDQDSSVKMKSIEH